MWAAAFDTVSFTEAVSWFRKRVPITDGEYLINVEQARKQAFWIAGVTHAEVIRQVHDSLKSALDKGIPFEEWKKQVAGTLRSAWGDFLDAKAQPARIETIMRNWAQGSYGRARWAQMSEPAIVRLRPYRMFDAVRDSRTSPICLACDGTVLPADHPWWVDHQPPLHHRCRSGVRALTPEKAQLKGITGTPTGTEAQKGFGTGGEWDGPDRAKFPAKVKPPKKPKPAKAPKPTEPAAPPLADRKRAAEAFKLADGGKAARKLLEEQIAHSVPGAVARDAVEGRAKASVLRIDNKLCRSYGANGLHHSDDGEINVTTDVMNRAKRALRLVGRTEVESRDVFQANALRTVVHESLHASSRLAAGGYRDFGKVLEEASVELTARRVVHDLIPALAKNTPYYARRYGFGSYQDYVDELTAIVRVHARAGDSLVLMSPEAAAERIAAASARVFGPGARYSSNDAMLDDWAGGLGFDPAVTERIKGAIRGLKP